MLNIETDNIRRQAKALESFYKGRVIGYQDFFEVRQLDGGKQILARPLVETINPYPKLPSGYSVVGETERLLVIQDASGKTDVHPKLGSR